MEHSSQGNSSTTRVGLLTGTEPLFAALFAVLLGGEQLSPQEWFGGLLIVVSTYWGRHVETRYNRNAPGTPEGQRLAPHNHE